jgi:hypothetical protein
MRSLYLLMNKKYHTDSVYFSGIASLAVIVASSLLAISPFLQQALAQETQMTNATNLMTNQSISNSSLDSVLNITRTAGDNAKSTAAEFVINATPSTNSMNMTNSTIVDNNNTSQ